jgi:4-hydroxy-4-methyl-2-oxoglutarate aldolase
MPDFLEAIRQFDTCTIANAIERFGVRLCNEGYTRPGLMCATGGFPSILGYAATCTVRSSDPPMTGRYFPDRTDWWAAIERVPAPRIAIIQDLDSGQGWASCLGEVHAAILKALGCVGVVTDGSVRDIPGVRTLEFPMFARSVAVSHSYSHVVDYGEAVEIFGLRIRSGDLLYADCHGVVSIPAEVVPDLPAAAAKIHERERRIVELCRSPDFTPERLRRALENTD